MSHDQKKQLLIPISKFRTTTFVISIVLALSSCGKKEEPKTVAPPALPVKVVKVEMTKVPVLIESVGQAQGSKEVEVRARVSGILEKQAYKEGDVVPVNALLFQIDKATYEIALAQAKADLAQQRAKVEQAKREEARLRPLSQGKAISQKDYDDAVSALETAKAAIQGSEAKVREASLNLSYTSVRAAIRGISGRAQKSEGSLVTAGSDSLLTTITQTDPIWVRFSFSEPEYTLLRVAGDQEAQVKLFLPDGKDLGVTGKLNFAASLVDPKLGTVQLRAEFPNKSLTVLPGQFVKAQVTAGEQDAILVPQAAVQQGDQGRFVWTIGADGKATAKPVEVGNWIGPNWVVLKGLNAGDRVIVDNLIKVKPGAPVQEKPAETKPAKRGIASSNLA